jgi:hypothetical protein
MRAAAVKPVVSSDRQTQYKDGHRADQSTDYVLIDESRAAIAASHSLTQGRSVVESIFNLITSAVVSDRQTKAGVLICNSLRFVSATVLCKTFARR